MPNCHNYTAPLNDCFERIRESPQVQPSVFKSMHAPLFPHIERRILGLTIRNDCCDIYCTARASNWPDLAIFVLIARFLRPDPQASGIQPTRFR